MFVCSCVGYGDRVSDDYVDMYGVQLLIMCVYVCMCKY